MSDAKSETPICTSQSEWADSVDDRLTERHLGRTLRAMYDALPTPPPSQRLNDLLRRLDAACAGTSEEDRTV